MSVIEEKEGEKEVDAQARVALEIGYENDLNDFLKRRRVSDSR